MRKVFLACLSFCIACSNDEIPVDCSLSDLEISLITTTNATGCNIADGKISLVAQGGTSGYSFKLQNGTFQPSGEFLNLTPGIYSVVVRDKTNCEVTYDNIILMTTNISFSADVVDNTKCVGGNGSITITMNGGQPPYQYKIGDENYTTENVFTDLESDNYIVTVKDNADCIVALNLNVGQGVTNTSWSTDILPIIQSSCANINGNGCHNGAVRTDLRVYANAKSNAALIKTYTQSGYMPFEGTITKAQKDLIACWVDEGALEN